MKKQSGITLISLIITIIIMLILAGVSLSMVMGDGSIIDQASSATEKTRAGEIKEQVDLAKSANQMIKYSNVGTKKSKAALVQELHSNNQITDEEKDKLLGENGQIEVDTITISDMVIDFSGLEEETVTISSFTLAESSFPSTGGTLSVSTVLEKSKASQEVTLKYTFYHIQGMGEETTYNYMGSEYDEVVTTTLTTNAFTRTLDYSTYRDRRAIQLEVFDKSGNSLATSEKVYFGIACLPADTLVSVVVEEEDENGKKTKKLKKKKIKDLTYDDDLLVWDFDKGCLAITKPLWLMKKQETEEYNLLKFSDGTELKTVRQHRIFNKELGKFTYPMSDETPVGTTTFKEDGTEVTLVSKEVVKEPVEFYNLISNYHMNAFAEGILTSCRFSNLYEIKDMKYVKDDRELASKEDYADIPEEYFYGLRLAEQPKEINRGNDDSHASSLKEHIMNVYVSNQKV